MIHKDDRIISMLLYNSHESDMTYQRPDMTTYVCQIRKNKPNTFFIPEAQLELFPPPPPKVNKVPYDPYKYPHQDPSLLYYGKNWKPIPDPNLKPH